MLGFTQFDLSLDENKIAHLQLNKPEKLNSMPLSFFDEFREAIEKLVDLQARVLVITALGKHFSAGIDLAVLSQSDLLANQSDQDKQKLKDLIARLQAGFALLPGAPFASLVAVDGLCLGAGLDLVSACDICFATESARFSIEEINVGLMADLGSLQRLPRRMHQGLVRKMALSGERVSARTLQSAGLVVEIFQNAEVMEEAVLKLASTIAAKEPSAIQASKLALAFNEGKTEAESLSYCAELQAEFLNVSAVQERVRTILKR
ncbi:MAG: enoyl-CoA hydratase/isomerase family protein [Candidatus Obscuribacter phosphatis]|uniref:Enoyl-CoA hydratase/isomerase family protein n=1 Tax=Candidatus Obscuribacter phosphatis TaxID=1906157 RepID=A0A8J7TNV8_9BACT|nr:enoyl-CoA hydratase/isomerase family protein [Candidatus Obscuribacter phosphatis]